MPFMRIFHNIILGVLKIINSENNVNKEQLTVMVGQLIFVYILFGLKIEFLLYVP